MWDFARGGSGDNASHFSRAGGVAVVTVSAEMGLAVNGLRVIFHGPTAPILLLVII